MPCANCTCQGKPSDCTSLATGASVALPGKRASNANGERTKLWSARPAEEEGGASFGSSSSGRRSGKSKSTYGTLQSSSDDDGEGDPLLATEVARSKCEKHNGVRGVCCRDLKQEQERHLLSPDVVRDVIIGLSDGLTVPFALTAGLSGTGSSRLVVLGGTAELVAGAISMGVGGYLSAKAELQHYRYMRHSTAQRVAQSCSGEMEREVCAILQPFGVPADVGALVAAKLQGVEMDERQQRFAGSGLPTPATHSAAASALLPHRRSDGLIGPERGLTPFLLRLGQGLEEVEESRVWQSALIIGASYFIGGFIPLLPYILFPSIKDALALSIAITGVVLLVFGVVKQKCTGAASDARGLLYGAISTLFVGAAAAGSSWIIVRSLEGGST